MRRVVFFTNPWASGKIRGEQIAQRLENAVVNPESISRDDVCIFVKCTPNDRVLKTVARCYLDIVDSWAALNYAKAKSCISVIAIGKAAHGYISNYLQRDDVILIPQHHCNFKRELRTRIGVTRAGFCGYRENFHLPFDDVSAALADIDIEFIYEVDQVENLRSVRDFYRSIDVQLCFRPNADELKNPLKLANAGSYRIPTVSYPESSYVAEWHGCFLRIGSLKKIVEGVKILKDSADVYNTLADAALKKAEDYHIDKIVDVYKEFLCL